MSATLTADVISTTYKKILFQKDDNKLYYTNSGGTADVEMTTLASPMTLSGLITASAGIKLGNNIIYSQNGTTSITTTNTTGDVTIAGDLTVTGNDIKSSSATAITMAGTNVTVVGDLTITGGNITNAITCDSSLTTTGLFTANANVVVGADADGTDRSITFGHTTLKSIIGIDDDQDVFAINTDGAFEAANDFELDTNGNATIKGNLTISGGNITNALTLDSTLAVSGNTTITGNLTFTGARDILFTEGDGLEIKDNNSLYVSMISNTMAITPPTTFAGKATFNSGVVQAPLAATGTVNLEHTDSGEIVCVDTSAASCIINLPNSDVSGVNYKIMVVKVESGDATPDYDLTINGENNADFFFGGVAHVDIDNSNAVVRSNNTANYILTCTDVEVGTVIELVSDGTKWNISGTVTGPTAPAFSGS